MMPLAVAARLATADDLPDLLRLYRLLEAEMEALRGLWKEADGLPEPVEDALAEAVADPETLVYVGTADGVTFGFILAYSAPLLPQAAGGRMATIKLVYTEEEARGVGIGEVMRDTVVDELRAAGHRWFDAHVLPGHRLAKNFFEAGGFSARFIIMNHEDD
ncbi:MAG: GNAT family N-acetyltransferase [Acidimicrobiia bacterium]|nr:GNAT family N-acetyltransferase [Acidimicrobiia bacterium]